MPGAEVEAEGALTLQVNVGTQLSLSYEKTTEGADTLELAVCGAAPLVLRSALFYVLF